VFDVIFDQSSNLCFLIDEKGIYKSNILYQKQSATVSLYNYISFRNMAKESEYWMYKDVLGDSLTFPQSQNIYHLFSLFDLGEHLMNAFEDETNTVIYCSDFQNKSPLMLSYLMQNETAIKDILSAFEYCDKLTVSRDDMLRMVEDDNPLTCNAFNVLFKTTKFLDTDQDVFRGQLKESFSDRFEDEEDQTFLLSKYIYFTSK